MLSAENQPTGFEEESRGPETCWEKVLDWSLDREREREKEQAMCRSRHAAPHSLGVSAKSLELRHSFLTCGYCLPTALSTAA